MRTIDEALKNWAWISDLSSTRVLDTTCLGDVILEDAEGHALILDVAAGQIRPYDAAEQEMVSNMGVLSSKLEGKGLVLLPGQCYGLKPNAIFKRFDAENLYVATLTEYVSFMGYFHGETKDLPDGTTVKLKVKP